MKTFNCKIKEQSEISSSSEIKVKILCENGKIWIQPKGYGDKTSADGKGYPVSLEICFGTLKLVVFDDINNEYAQIISLEEAKESNRIKKEN
jgi:hypothetical protein